MKDFHVTRGFLAALQRGELPHAQAVSGLVDHVLALCPVCRSEREAFVLECTLGPSGQLAVAEPVLSWLVTVAPDFEGRRRRAEQSARRDLRDLLALPPAARAGRLERSRRRFRNPELVELLLALAHQRIRASPWEAHELAQLALEVSWQLGNAEPTPSPQEIVALRARALVHSGNALRVQGQWVAAEREFGTAREMVHEAGVSDLLVIAELDWLEGVLRGTLGQTDSAIRLLERAILFFELGGDPRRAAVSRLSLGALHQELAQPEQAAAAIYPIVDAIDETTEPLLALSARHNLTLCLCELGRFFEARQIFLRTEPLYGRFDDFWTRLRRRWAEARIERGLGRPEHALDLLAEIRAGFLDQDVRSDAAIASREIAEVQRDLGRNVEALEAARFALESFAEQGSETEYRRSLILLESLELATGLSPTARPKLHPPGAAAAVASPARPGDVHVTREILRAHRVNRLSAETVLRMYLEHLPSLCPQCASDRDSPAPPATGTDPAGSHGVALRRLGLRLPLLVRRVEREEGRARRQLAWLLRLPREQRLQALEGLPAGPVGYALGELLLATAQHQLGKDDVEALAQAELVRCLAERIVATPDGPPALAVAELQARACLIEGDGLRRNRRLSRAEKSFATARVVTREHGILDPELAAELDFGEALLRRDQGRLPAALRLFRRAGGQFQTLGASREAIRAAIELGATLLESQATERGIETLLEALAGLDPARESERCLAALAHEHLARAAFDLGRESDARRHLEIRLALIDAPGPEDCEQLLRSRAGSSD